MVTQPAKKTEHAVVEDKVVAASVQTKGLHSVDPDEVFEVHGPSEPIIPPHPAA